jgi:dihydrofolate reductase
MQKIIIAAIDEKLGIGYKGKLLTHIPEDLKRFRQLTIGHTIIMGRKTWESLPKKPLPDRIHIIITRQKDFTFAHEQVFVVQSIESAFEVCENHNAEKVFIIGGGEIYTLALPYTDILELTHIHQSFEADVFFPEYSNDFTPIWQENHTEYTFARYMRIKRT